MWEACIRSTKFGVLVEAPFPVIILRSPWFENPKWDPHLTRSFVCVETCASLYSFFTWELWECGLGDFGKPEFGVSGNITRLLRYVVFNPSFLILKEYVIQVGVREKDINGTPSAIFFPHGCVFARNNQQMASPGPFVVSSWGTQSAPA